MLSCVVLSYNYELSLRQSLFSCQGRSQEFATGEQKGVWGRKSPSGVQGQSSGGSLGPQKLETHAEYSTEQSHNIDRHKSRILFRDYTLKTFPATTGEGGMHPLSPVLLTNVVTSYAPIQKLVISRLGKVTFRSPWYSCCTCCMLRHCQLMRTDDINDVT